MSSPENRNPLEQLKNQGPLYLRRQLRDQGLDAVMAKSHRHLRKTPLYGYLTNACALVRENEQLDPTEPDSLLRLGFFWGALVANSVLDSILPGGYAYAQPPLEFEEVMNEETGQMEYICSSFIAGEGDRVYAELPEYHDMLDEHTRDLEFDEHTMLHFQRGFGFMFAHAYKYLAAEQDAFAQEVEEGIRTVDWDEEARNLPI